MLFKSSRALQTRKKVHNSTFLYIDVPNDLRRKIRRAIEDQDEASLEVALDDLKQLGLPTAQKDIEKAEYELGVMRARRGKVSVKMVNFMLF